MRSAGDVWHLMRSGRNVGPMSDMELAVLARTGAIGADDHIWRHGLADWVRAGSVPGLLPPRDEPSAPAARPDSSARPSIAARYELQPAARGPAPSLTHTVSRAPVASVRDERAPVADWQRALAATLPSNVRRELPRDNGTVPTAGLGPRQSADSEKNSAAVVRAETPAPPAEAGNGAPSSRFMPRELMGPEFSNFVADAIVQALARHDIRHIDDLTSDDRLRAVAVYAYDALPGSIRLIVFTTFGRASVETVLFNFLARARGMIPKDSGSTDLHSAIRALAASDWISQQLGEAYQKARSGLGSVVSSYVPTVSAASSWAQTAKLALTNRASMSATAPAR